MVKHLLMFYCVVKMVKSYIILSQVHVDDQADTTASEQTEPLPSTPRPDADDLKTDKAEEQHDKQSPRSPDPQNTEKVMLLKYKLCAVDLGRCVYRLRMQEMQHTEQGKTVDR